MRICIINQLIFSLLLRGQHDLDVTELRYVEVHARLVELNLLDHIAGCGKFLECLLFALLVLVEDLGLD